MKRIIRPLGAITCLLLLATAAWAQQGREEVWKKQIEFASQALSDKS